MDFSQRNFGKWSHKATGLDAKQIDRARKVYALVIGGATEGEKAAAMGRLTVIATEARGGVDTLVRALS